MIADNFNTILSQALWFLERGLVADYLKLCIWTGDADSLETNADEVAEKLGVRRRQAYNSLHKLNKAGFIKLTWDGPKYRSIQIAIRKPK
jgi:hypothetical protein